MYTMKGWLGSEEILETLNLHELVHRETFF